MLAMDCTVLMIIFIGERMRFFLTTTASFLFSVIPTHSPEIWQETMGVLQDQCPEEGFETIRAIVSKELDFDAVFASFEEKPIGAASIGQGTTSCSMYF